MNYSGSGSVVTVKLISELFCSSSGLLEWFEKYVDFWKCRSRRCSWRGNVGCSVCGFLMRKKGEMDFCEFRFEKKKQIEFSCLAMLMGSRLPVDVVSAIVCGFVFAKSCSNYSETKIMEILDPFSLFFHFVLQVCSHKRKDVLRTGIVLVGHLRSLVVDAFFDCASHSLRRFREENSPVPEKDCAVELSQSQVSLLMCDVDVDCTDPVEKFSAKAFAKEKAKIKDLVQMLSDECSTCCSSCVFSNEGWLSRMSKSDELLSDSRFLVSLDWIDRNYCRLGLPLGFFVGDAFYVRGQIGSFWVDENGRDGDDDFEEDNDENSERDEEEEETQVQEQGRDHREDDVEDSNNSHDRRIGVIAKKVNEMKRGVKRKVNDEDNNNQSAHFKKVPKGCKENTRLVQDACDVLGDLALKKEINEIVLGEIALEKICAEKKLLQIDSIQRSRGAETFRVSCRGARKRFGDKKRTNADVGAADNFEKGADSLFSFERKLFRAKKGPKKRTALSSQTTRTGGGSDFFGNFLDGDVIAGDEKIDNTSQRESLWRVRTPSSVWKDRGEASDSSSDVRKCFAEEHRKAVDDVMGKADVVLKMYEILHSRGFNRKMDPLRKNVRETLIAGDLWKVNLIFSPCIWCSLSIVCQLRRVIQDLCVMANAKGRIVLSTLQRKHREFEPVITKRAKDGKAISKEGSEGSDSSEEDDDEENEEHGENDINDIDDCEDDDVDQDNCEDVDDNVDERRKEKRKAKKCFVDRETLFEMHKGGFCVFPNVVCRRLTKVVKKRQNRGERNGYNFGKFVLAVDEFNETVREWSEEKYPFVRILLDKCRRIFSAVDVGDYLFEHVSQSKAVSCACNVRKMSTETDLFTSNFGKEPYLCLLPFLWICFSLRNFIFGNKSDNINENYVLRRHKILNSFPDLSIDSGWQEFRILSSLFWPFQFQNS